MRTLKKIALIAAISSAPISGGAAMGCPNCKEALASQTGEGANLKDGYFYSILLMMAMPFTLLGTGAFFVVRSVKRGSLPEL